MLTDKLRHDIARLQQQIDAASSKSTVYYWLKGQQEYARELLHALTDNDGDALPAAYDERTIEIEVTP